MKRVTRVLALSSLAWMLATPAAAGRIVFQAEVIEGEIQKPEVAVFLTRQNLNDKYRLELRESFLPKILEAVENPPF